MRKPIMMLCTGTALMLCLPSCATNTIRLDRATTMGEAGKAATEGTRDVMQQVRAANRSVLIDLVTLDPACTLPTPRIANVNNNDGSNICRKGVHQEGDFPITRWSTREFKPTLAVIDGISAYLGAVDAIVTRKPIDLAAELAQAEGKLRTISDDLTAIAGEPPLPSLSADQKAAVDGTLALLSELIDESARVRDLRQFELSDDAAKLGANLDALGAANAKLVAALRGQLLHQQTLVTRQLRDAPVAARRPLVARQLELIETREALPDLRAALVQTVVVFREAHQSYLALLNGRDTLTPAEKRKAAAVTEARVLGALSALASIVKAF